MSRLVRDGELVACVDPLDRRQRLVRRSDVEELRSRLERVKVETGKAASVAA